LREATAAPGGQAGESNAMQLAIQAEAAHLERLRDQLDRLEDVHRAARLLIASRPLPVLGLRAAAPLAGYFGYFAAKVHPDVRLLDGGGTQLLDRLDQALAAGAGAMLAMVLPRYPRESLDAIREARAAGCAIVAITDSAVSPVAETADVVLPAAVGTQLVFDLHTGPMAMAMVLLQAMCDAAPEPVQRRLEEFEATAARRHIFVA
jgi:DNA-binding MurR/RpiR family transcriptional regulator